MAVKAGAEIALLVGRHGTYPDHRGGRADRGSGELLCVEEVPADLVELFTRLGSPGPRSRGVRGTASIGNLRYSRYVR